MRKTKNNFLKKFIEYELYLQNPPLETSNFVKFCKDRGLNTNEQELEFFEKEKLLFPIIRIDTPKIIKTSNVKEKVVRGNYKIKKNEEFISFCNYNLFDEYGKKYLLNWLKDGLLYDPKTKPFKEWVNFQSNKSERKVISLYSSFQIFWLQILKDNSRIIFPYHWTEVLSSNTNLFDENGKIFAEVDLKLKIKISDTLQRQLLGDQTYNYLDHKNDIQRRISERWDWSVNKTNLSNVQKDFDDILLFLLSIQSVYYPYVKSGGGRIHISIDEKKWADLKKKFNLKRILRFLNISIEEIVRWYQKFSEKAHELLGVKRDDWMQIWKNIKWNKKDTLTSHVRLGIEYLQWAQMLKKMLEEHLQRRVLDVDEILNYSHKDILNIGTDKLNENDRSTRSIRNEKYFDTETKRNYYYDKFKRLFYLSNDFGLDYHPRVMVFVEGETEETIFPKFFEWYFDKPENLGIEIVNFQGVDKLLSTSANAESLRNLIKEIEKQDRQKFLSKNKKTALNNIIWNLKNIDIVISNWTSFISYNLEKWQIIPFFVSDNEGNVKKFLEAEKPVKFKGINYNIPPRWKYLWGVDNNNKPFSGKDFEFANFNDKELAEAIRKALNNKQITVKRVKEVRDSNLGINNIHEKVKKNKKKISDVLQSNLITDYKDKNHSSLLNRPIFKIIDKILDILNLNHMPTDTKLEKENEKIIKEWLEDS